MPVLRAAACLAGIFLLSATVQAADGGAPAGDAGQCSSSTECAPPTPYCQPATRVCVECLGDRNCGSGRVCDEPTGKCTGCLSDGDCTGLTPYCDKSLGDCAECLNDANCGSSGLECRSGTCGFCGDGICGPQETIYGEAVPAPEERNRACPDDCAALCPTKDVGGALGRFSIGGTGLRNLFGSACGLPGTVDASFKWKAPYDGTFFFGGSGVGFNILRGGCSGSPFDGFCTGPVGDAGQATIGFPVTVSEGEEIVAVIDTGMDHVDSVTFIVWEPLTCPPAGCPSPSSDASAEAGPSQAPSQCLDHARARGEAICAGVDCVCRHCPEAYDECSSTPGCSEVQECMRDNDCVATACYNSGVCRSVVDSLGGVSGPAFRASARIQSCELTFGCTLPCGVDGGGSDGSVTRPKPDAGRLCAPGRKVACPCEGGTGTKVCSEDGDAFGSCECGGAPPASTGAACNCRVHPGSNPDLGGLQLVLALVLASGLARRLAAR